MKAKDVIRLLEISRGTLHNYYKQGKIRGEVLQNGQYDYNKEDVYKLFNQSVPRKTVIYSRVSTSKQKRDLENQRELLKQFCFARGYTVDASFSDIASGISFENRDGFFDMLDLILKREIERVVITYKDRLSRVGFGLFKHLFSKFQCEIIVMSELGDEKLDSKEVFDEIVSLLHCYSMKLYSSRKKQKLKEFINDHEEESTNLSTLPKT